MSKKGLGRGLDALLANSTYDKNLEIREIPISEIEPNPEQPRKEFDLESLEHLAESIKLHGLLQPILVKSVGDRYHIIAGERRYRASKIAGLESIACLVQDCTDREMAEKALVENLQRSNLSPVEEGRAYAKLIEEYKLTQEEIAQRVGKGRATIANLIRVIQLPPPVLLLIQEDKISLGHAKILLSLPDKSLQVLIGQKIASSSLSVRETEELTNKILNRFEIKRTKKLADPGIDNLEERLRSSFQTKVRLKGSLDKGKIEIEYFSVEELNRLLEIWNVIVD